MIDDKIQLRGVNLGGWLVLEKWMTPSLFAGIKGADEYSFCTELGAQARDILKIHRDHFVTETDFKWIADHGLNAVRLPVGYWIFGASNPFVGGIEYIDKAFDWAEKYGLKVVLDLHGAPGSQNGYDHSGQAGDIRWHKGDNIDKTLEVLKRLCKRYTGVPSLVAVEVLNEPNWGLGKHRLSMFYERAYELIRQELGEEVAVVIPDAYKPRRWKHVLSGANSKNVWLDVHLYQTFGVLDRRRSIAGQLRKVLHRRRLIRALQRSHPVVVGEWSAALPAATLKRLHQEERGAAHQAYAMLQLFAQHEAYGTFYWSYKTEGGGAWSLRDCVERGWLPHRFD